MLPGKIKFRFKFFNLGWLLIVLINLWIINLNLILTCNMYLFEFVSFDWFPLCKLKWNWPGHVVRRTDNHWTTCITFWMPHGHTRNWGRPRIRWRDNLDGFGKHWHHVTQNVVQWRSVRKAYIQQYNGHSTAETDHCVIERFSYDLEKWFP